MGVFKVKNLRSLSKDALMDKLEIFKKELGELNITKRTNSTASKLSQIYVVRKRIAKVLTVIHQNQKDASKKYYADKKYKPLDLRPRLTRAKRREMTEKQKNLKTRKEQRKRAMYPPRLYTLKA